MTVAELLSVLLDPDAPMPQTITVRITRMPDNKTWEILGANGKLVYSRSEGEEHIRLVQGPGTS